MIELRPAEVDPYLNRKFFYLRHRRENITATALKMRLPHCISIANKRLNVIRKSDKLWLTEHWGAAVPRERAMPGILFQSTNERSDPMLENVAHNESFSSSSFSFLLFCILCRFLFYNLLIIGNEENICLEKKAAITLQFPIWWQPRPSWKKDVMRPRSQWMKKKWSGETWNERKKFWDSEKLGTPFANQNQG